MPNLVDPPNIPGGGRGYESWDAASLSAPPPPGGSATDYLEWRYGYPSPFPSGQPYAFGGAANPWMEGIRFGALGSLLGLGWAGGHAALRRMQGGRPAPADVVNPMLLGALIGGGLGTWAGFDQRARMERPASSSAMWAEEQTRKDMARRRLLGLPPLHKDASGRTRPWRKSAQYMGAGNDLQGKTLQDLLDAIAGDPNLGIYEKQKLIQQVLAVTGGAPEGMPLSALLSGGAGGVIGLIIGRYFSMGPVGQAVSAAVGYGAGRALWNAYNRPPDPSPGWRFIE